jgi:hypothetical protein
MRNWTHYRAGITVLASTCLMAAPAVGLRANAEEPTRCTAELVITLSPGVGSQPSSGVFHSEGDPVPFVCGGRRGTMSEDGRYGTSKPVTCTTGGDGWGIHYITLDGKTIRNTFTTSFGQMSDGVVSGRFEGERYSGTFTVTPIEGDCTSRPMTRIKAQIDGLLRP